jgi:hypothetical protein
MVDASVAAAPIRKVRKEERPSIQLPDGEVLDPRVRFAAGVGLSEKSLVKLNLPTTYIGACAYVKRNASLELIASRARRRNEPPRRRRPK